MVRCKLPALVWQEAHRRPDRSNVGMHVSDGAQPKQIQNVDPTCSLTKTSTGVCRVRGNGATRCCSELCGNSNQASSFYKIERGCQVGGKDWTEMVGSTLCEECYHGYAQAGTLSRRNPVPGSGGASKRCGYVDCTKPEGCKQYYTISEGTKAGVGAGRDWSSLFGQVLCHNCYVQYIASGTLERKQRGKPSAQASSKVHTEKKLGASNERPQLERQSEINRGLSYEHGHTHYLDTGTHERRTKKDACMIGSDGMVVKSGKKKRKIGLEGTNVDLGGTIDSAHDALGTLEGETDKGGSEFVPEATGTSVKVKKRRNWRENDDDAHVDGMGNGRAGMYVCMCVCVCACVYVKA
jgi:hypothetical protein